MKKISMQISQKIKTKQLLGRDLLFDCLNDIELVICSDIVMGETIETIAQRQHLAVTEVELIKKAIFEKLHIETEVALVHLAIRNGLLDKDNHYFN